MPLVPLSEIPDHGRLWVFPSTRALDAAERERCLGEVDGFLSEWAAHGVPLRSARELREGRFLVVGVDVDAEAPSGCSIDALMGRLRVLGGELGLAFIDHAPVWYRDRAGVVRCVSRSDFRALAEASEVGPETSVFDTTLTRLSELRAGRLERAASDSWHGKAFFRERATS